MGIKYLEEAPFSSGTSAIKYLEPDKPPPDQYRAAAEAEYARNPAMQARTSGTGGYAARIGLGIPWSDEITAAAFTPFKMIEQGTLDPREGYAYAKARENLMNEKARENTAGIGGTLAELSGGLATGAGVLGSGTRAAAVTIGGRTIPAGAVNYGANVVKAAGLGTFAGAGEGDSLEERGKHALIGGALGGALGAALPPVLGGAQWAARAAQLPRLRDPERIATEHTAKLMRDAGVTAEEVANRMGAARAAGQVDYTVADAIGHAAERKLDALHKVPGPARENIVETLSGRDLNMVDRVGEMVGRKLNAPRTALEESEALIERASTSAAPLYRQAEQIPTWNQTIQRIIEDPISQAGLRQGVELQRLRSLGTDRPFRPTDAQITGFNEAGDAIITGVPNAQTLHTLKVGLDRMIEGEMNPVTRRLTARGNAIDGVRRRLLAQMDAENPVYRQARAAYSGPMQVENAVRFGQGMPTQGRAADNIRQYAERPPVAQQGIRIGVADKARGDLERTGNIPTYLRAKSQKGQQELEAISPYGPATLREMLAREEAMQRMSRGILGGSQTAGRLADVAQGPGAAEAFGVAGQALTGNFMGALRSGGDVLRRIAQGESEAQRTAIARALLARAGDPAAVAALRRNLELHELQRQGQNPNFSLTRNRAPRYPTRQ